MGVNGYEACCMNCRFWTRAEVGKSHGHCRHDPPVVLAIMRPHPSQNVMIQVADTFFPMTADTICCGKHEPEMKKMAAAINFQKLALEDEELDPA